MFGILFFGTLTFVSGALLLLSGSVFFFPPLVLFGWALSCCWQGRSDEREEKRIRLADERFFAETGTGHTILHR